MKKPFLLTSLFVGLLAAPCFADGRAGSVAPGGGIRPFGSYSVTVPETAAGLAGDSVELDGLRLAYEMDLTGDDTLGSGLRVELDCDMSTPANPGTDTRHCGSVFFETNLAQNQQYFGFGSESSIKNRVGASAHANGAAIVDIWHGKIFNDLNITQNYPLIGGNPRLDFFATSSESVSFSTHVYGIFLRPEAYYEGDPIALWGWYNPLDDNIQNINAGNVFKVSIASAVSSGATLDLSKACGGRLLLTSTGAITLNGTTAFSPGLSQTLPTSSAATTRFTRDCDVRIVNVNTTPGRDITIVDTADFLPATAGNVLLGDGGGEINVWALVTPTTLWVEGGSKKP